MRARLYGKRSSHHVESSRTCRSRRLELSDNSTFCSFLLNCLLSQYCNRNVRQSDNCALLLSVTDQMDWCRIGGGASRARVHFLRRPMNTGSHPPSYASFLPNIANRCCSCATRKRPIVPGRLWLPFWDKLCLVEAQVTRLLFPYILRTLISSNSTASHSQSSALISRSAASIRQDKDNI